MNIQYIKYKKKKKMNMPVAPQSILDKIAKYTTLLHPTEILQKH